jgi:hypothetical protein
VGTTGRTSVQAIGVGNLTVHGAATNLTASRAPQPFQNGYSGLSRLGSATFQGPTDAVGLDVNGPIGSLTYVKGMGDPTDVFAGKTATGQDVPATLYGIPKEQASYAALGNLGGQVTATRIGNVRIGPANVVTTTPTNPDFIMARRTGSVTATVRPGTAMVNSLIASSGNIGNVHVVGDQVNSEIKTGFHYGSFAAGLEGTRAASRINRIKVTGNQLNGVVSATYRPNNNIYGSTGSIAGPGAITGKFLGRTLATGAITPLTNTGSGFYAARKNGYLPPPDAPANVLARILKQHPGRPLG